MSNKIEDILDEKGVYVSTTVGVSMFPMLRNRRDTIVIKPFIKSGNVRLRKYDVPLYRRGDDYVLHRIVGVTDTDYIICGDNCLAKEYNISDEQIIGVLRAFFRDDKEINMNGVGYRLYCRVWVAMYPLRVIAKKCWFGLKRMVKHVF